MRTAKYEPDYWQIRQFLREVYRFTGVPTLNWQTYRFDYWRWHVLENITQARFEEVVFLWETLAGQLTAVLHPESLGEAFLQIHPEERTPELEEEMIAVAEERLAGPGPTGRLRLRVWAHEHDTLRQEILDRRGYVKINWSEYLRRRSLSLPIPDAPPPPGYLIRSLGGIEELPARSWLSWQAFHPNEPDERYRDWEWYHNTQRAPLYRRDLDLVTVAPDGSLAAFATIWFDDVTRTGAFEPVGTAPAHQKRGLGKAVMAEGLRRLKRLGATLATVGSYSAQAGALYDSVGFTEYELSELWVKEL